MSSRINLFFIYLAVLLVASVFAAAAVAAVDDEKQNVCYLRYSGRFLPFVDISSSLL
jgi:hypothetical protein